MIRKEGWMGVGIGNCLGPDESAQPLRPRLVNPECCCEA